MLLCILRFCFVDGLLNAQYLRFMYFKSVLADPFKKSVVAL